MKPEQIRVIRGATLPPRVEQERTEETESRKSKLYFLR
jgi:hypothetical protein